MKKIIKFKTVDTGPWTRANVCVFNQYIPRDYELVYDEQPDIIFYSTSGSEHVKYKDAIRIFYCGENVRPDFDVCDYAIGFDRMEFGDRYIRKPIYTKKVALNKNFDYLNRKFCNFIYSNNDENLYGVKVRNLFFEFLSKYKHIDSPGKVKNNMVNAITPRNYNWVEGKLEFLNKYKFTIAIENCFYDGYVTEKLIHPFIAQSIPIYMGDPRITLDFNPNSFVNCNDFNNWNELLEYIGYLDNNDDAYMKMLMQSPMRDDYTPPDITAFLKNIFDNGRIYRKNAWPRYRSNSITRYSSVINHIWDNLALINNLESANSKKILDSIIHVNDYNAAKIYKDILDPILNEVKSKTSLDLVLNTYISVFHDGLYSSNQIAGILKSAGTRLLYLKKKPWAKITWINDLILERSYRQLLIKFWPMAVGNKTKTRIGGLADGAYVMLDPAPDGAAFCFCNEKSIHWMLKIEQLGWTVLWGGINLKKQQYKRPNIFFLDKEIVTELKSDKNQITFPELLKLQPKHKENILHLDLAGEEWEILEKADPEIMNAFKQIIVEFHGLADSKNVEKYTKILDKLCKTHAPLHFHYNNVGPVLGFRDFFISNVCQATFMRRDSENFSPSQEVYPTPLDYPNFSQLPDIFIGKFADIASPLNNKE